MATYSTMQARIADELDRADLTSEIQTAIQDAIGFYERRYFYFTSAPTSFTFSTVVGQEYYTSTDNAAIGTAAQIYRINGTFYGLRRPLHKRAWEYIDNKSTLLVSKAQPEDWAYNGESIRLYPIPIGVFVLTCAAIQRPVRPSAGTDGGVWMNDAEALIRTKAKIYLIKNIIRGSNMVEELALLEGPDGKGGQLAEEYAAIAGETTSREAVGTVEPSRF